MSTTATEAPAEQPNGDAAEGTEETPTPTVEDLQAQIEELKKHSRKWEDRAKENFEARQELDRLRRAQMSDDERRAAEQKERDEALEAARKDAENARREALRLRIATRFSISDEDADLFLTGSDEETLTRQAERLAGRSSGGPRPNPAQGKRGASAPATSADLLGDFIDSHF